MNPRKSLTIAFAAATLAFTGVVPAFAQTQRAWPAAHPRRSRCSGFATLADLRSLATR